MPVNPIDVAFVVVIAYGVFKSLDNKFLEGVRAFGKLALACLFALRFSYMASQVLATIFGLSMVYTPIITFILVFVMMSGVIYLLSLLFNILFKAARLHTYKRAIGIMIWFFLLVLCFSTIMNLAESGQLLNPTLLNTSRVYRYVYPLAEIMFCKLSFVMPAINHILEAIELLFLDAADAMAGECY